MLVNLEQVGNVANLVILIYIHTGIKVATALVCTCVSPPCFQSPSPGSPGTASTQVLGIGNHHLERLNERRVGDGGSAE